jgi:hypothetical protein
LLIRVQVAVLTFAATASGAPTEPISEIPGEFPVFRAEYDASQLILSSVREDGRPFSRLQSIEIRV